MNLTRKSLVVRVEVAAPSCARSAARQCRGHANQSSCCTPGPGWPGVALAQVRRRGRGALGPRGFCDVNSPGPPHQVVIGPHFDSYLHLERGSKHFDSAAGLWARGGPLAGHHSPHVRAAQTKVRPDWFKLREDLVGGVGGGGVLPPPLPLHAGPSGQPRRACVHACDL